MIGLHPEDERMLQYAVEPNPTVGSLLHVPGGRIDGISDFCDKLGIVVSMVQYVEANKQKHCIMYVLWSIG